MMSAEGDVDGGVAAHMARIRRKPVSSAFYASDFPPIFAPDSPHPQMAERDGAPHSPHLRLEPNDSSDRTLYDGDPVTAGSESHVSLLDVYNRTISHEAGSQSPDPAVTESRTTYETSYIEDVSDLPTDDNHSGRVVQPAKPRPQGSSGNYPNRQMWTPIWLKKRTLVAFVVLYIVLLSSVILLWHFSRDKNGFAPRISTNHYTWTYGPTAVLVIVLGLWRQVEYFCKVLAPWHEMKHGAKSSRSLFLDYVSPFQVASLWLAFKQKTMFVIAAILGFACLKLVIIFSTGLLVLSPIVLTNSTYPIEVRAVFDASKFLEILPRTTSVLAYYGHFVNNLTWPVGAKDHLAYSSFGAEVTLPLNSEISMEADVMLPQFDCEAAEATTHDLYIGDVHVYRNVATFKAPSCTIKDVVLDVPSPKVKTPPPRQIIGQYSLVDCKHKVTTNLTNIYMTDTWPADLRFIVVITDYRYTQAPGYRTLGNSTSFNATSYSTRLESINAVICKPAYSIIKANLTYDTSKQDESDRFSILKPEVLAGKLLDGFSVDNLSSAVDQSIIDGGAIYDYLRPDLYIKDFLPEAPDTLSRLMLLTEGESSLKDFLADTEMMKSAAARTLNGIAAQYAQQNLLKPASNTSIGRLVYSEDRLKVQTTSMALIVACLVLLIILTMVVLFNRPHNVVPRDPSSLGGMAVIMANKQCLQDLLLDLGRSPTSKIRQNLSTFHFTSYLGRNSHNEASFQIQVSKIQPVTEIAKAPSESSHWHRPIAIKKWFLTAVLPLPLILIVVLEGLQQASDRHNGFLTLQQDTGQDSNSTNILTRYIPSFVVLLVATLFNMLDFTVTTFAPFSALRSGSSPAQRSIFSQLMSKPPPVALYKAAINRQLGTLSSSIAGLTGPVLAIIVSGLLVVENVIVPSNITVQQLDSFNIDTYNALDNNATTTFSMMERFNLSSPAFTYNDLAFPRIKLSEESTSFGRIANATNSMSLSVQLPALRASLDCKILPQEDILVSYNNNSTSWFDVLFLSKLHQAERCFGQNLTYRFEFGIIPDPYDDGSFAGSTAATFSPAIRFSDCPSFALIFGSVKPHTIENVTFMTCSEHMQEVRVQATFILPHFTIDQSHPPTIDESTVKILQNTTSGLTAVQNDVPHKISSLISDSTILHLDSFTLALAFGSDATPPEELVGPANAAKLVNRTNYLYSKFMAQVINSEKRSAPLHPNPTYNATITLPTNRLKMNNGSKVTLQILLAVMFVCGSLAYLLTDMRRTLPHNPHTLAGTMSLLAGSEMASRAIVPEGAEWMSDEELRKAGVFEGYLFSLGWWNDRTPGGTSNGKKRFGIDIGRAEKES